MGTLEYVRMAALLVSAIVMVVMIVISVLIIYFTWGAGAPVVTGLWSAVMAITPTVLLVGKIVVMSALLVALTYGVTVCTYQSTLQYMRTFAPHNLTQPNKVQEHLTDDVTSESTAKGAINLNSK